MQRIVMGMLGGIFLLTACGQATPVPVIDSATPSPTATRTAPPSATPTASITPLPTIPTFTPTFDVSTILTATPALMAECPIKSTASQINFEVFPSGQKYVGHPTIDEFLIFLNSGGHLGQLNNELKQIDSQYEIKDITNDGIPDLVIVSGAAFQTINILWCRNGRYNLFPKDGAEAETLGSEQVRFSVQDLNHNGIPDILSIGDGRSLNINILEWDGENFRDLTADETGVNALMTNASEDNFELRDLENDGISEFILNGSSNNWYYPGEPLRNQIDTYYWNGKNYSSLTSFSSPQYRFQAIQDGDRLTAQGSYNEAIKSYQNAIDSEVLDWWSEEKFEAGRSAAINSTTPPVLNTDTTEYPRLAAYAYYRIMLLHLVQGYESDASTVYNTLQEKFGNDQHGHTYVELATVFWNAYQPTHKMYDGCAAAIQYAAEHPDILIPLGSDYHGTQSHHYKPEDVCTFR
jgi:hypothetical protein